MENVNRIVDNARRMGHFTETAAFAIELSTGKKALSVCVWCADRYLPQEKYTDFRLPRGGDCCMCAYTGVDTLVVVKR